MARALSVQSEVPVPRRHLIPAFLAGLIGLLLAGSAEATIRIDFDTYPGGGAVPPGASIGDQWQSLGVRFTDGAGGPAGASNNSCSISAPNHAYATPIVAWFVDPITLTPALTDYVGAAQDYCWVPGEGIDMRAYDLAGNLIASRFNPPGSENGSGRFEAISFPSAVIARVEFHCVLQGIDNFEFGAPTALDVVRGDAGLGLHPLVNPVRGRRLHVVFDLPASTPARLELLDLQGRRVAMRDIGSMGAGRHAVTIEPAHGLRPGMHFLRLTQSGRSVHRRVTLLD